MFLLCHIAKNPLKRLYKSFYLLNVFNCDEFGLCSIHLLPLFCNDWYREIENQREVEMNKASYTHIIYVYKRI